LQVNTFHWYHPGVPKKIPGRQFARNLVERRSLIFQLVKRDFQQRYVGSVVGWLWGLIHPLVLLGIYTVVFTVLNSSPLGPGDVTRKYPLFLFAGMLPWLLFSETVQRSSGSLVEQANLITKTMFPSEIMPVSIFLSSLVSHLLAVALFVVVVTVDRQSVSPGIVLLPVGMLLLGLFGVGIGWIAASLQVYLRDTAQVVTVFMTLWFWITPIMMPESKFPVERYPRAVTVLLTANPLVYIVRVYRQMLLGTVIPWSDLLAAAGFAVGTFVVGGLFFRHMKRGFADVL
jgi:ABC-type polysaccharide/polyol phosphate export permease